MFKDEAFSSDNSRDGLRVTNHFEPFKKIFSKFLSKLQFSVFLSSSAGNLTLSLNIRKEKGFLYIIPGSIEPFVWLFSVGYLLTVAENKSHYLYKTLLYWVF